MKTYSHKKQQIQKILRSSDLLRYYLIYSFVKQCFYSVSGFFLLAFTPCITISMVTKTAVATGHPMNVTISRNSGCIYPANPFFSPAGWQYKLRADEALVLYTELPPECKYYSFINYIMFTEEKEGKNYKNEKGYFQVGNEDVGFYHPIFGSIGTSVSDGRVSCD